MGHTVARPEKPLHPGGPLATFASVLRALRHQAGLTYRDLSARTGCGVSVLSTAAGGRTLPTWEVTQAFVRACGGDADQWRERWNQARAHRKERREAVASGLPQKVACEAGDDLDIVEDFSAGLRRLRAMADLEYGRLVMLVKCPANLLADVVAGRRFPSWKLTEDYVLACGGDVPRWRLLWERARDQWVAFHRLGANDVVSVRGSVPRREAHSQFDAVKTALDVSRHKAAQVEAERPYIHADWIPRLAKVNTQVGFAALLQELRQTLGLSYGDIQRASRIWPGVSDRGLPISTIGDLVKGKSVPSEETLMAFLSACGIFRRETWQWLAAWERPQVVSAPSRGAIRVSEADARELGVHAAITDGSLADMPDYVPREVDNELREMLSVALTGAAFILIVGGAAAGKTRLAYEAIRAKTPDWWLLRPSNSSDLAGLAESPIPYSLIWLDEIQRCLADERGVESIRRLLRGATPNIIVGTIRPEHYQPHLENYERGRQLLSLATHLIHVRSELASSEREEAQMRSLSDSRIRSALACKDYGLFQLLAAGPELVSRWEMPCDPYGAAVITAAVEARRMGVASPLSPELLRAVSQGYLKAGERARATSNWFENALAYATTPLLGGASALAPVADQQTGGRGYVAADYLVQHANQSGSDPDPESVVWSAYTARLTSAQDLYELGNAAMRCGHSDHAEALYRRAALAGADEAWPSLAHLLAEQDRFGEAERLLWEATEGGMPNALPELVGLLDQLGKFGDAERLLREAADAGSTEARHELVRLLLKENRYEEAESVLFQAVAVGGAGARHLLADILLAQGRIRLAEGLLPDEVSKRERGEPLIQGARPKGHGSKTSSPPSRKARRALPEIAPAGDTLTTPMPFEPFR